MFFHARGTAPGSASSMGDSEGLGQIQAHAVKTHISGTHLTHYPVQVGAVIEQQPSCVMDYPCYFRYFFFKETERIWICEHQSCCFLRDGLLYYVMVNGALFISGFLHHIKARHRSAL